MLKKLIATTVATAAISLQALAIPAVPDTLAAYIALGSGGATIGSTLFSDFTLLPVQGGATQISASSILVNPINLFNNLGLEFVLNQTAATGELFEMRISYKVSDASITGASVALNGSLVDFDGANTALLDLTQPAQTLIAFDIGLASDNPVATAFGSLAVLDVESDIVVDGGTFGSATLRSATNHFVVAGPVTPVPEPGAALAGFAVLGICVSSLSRRRC